jgi:hypothetical protein
MNLKCWAKLLKDNFDNIGLASIRHEEPESLNRLYRIFVKLFINFLAGDVLFLLNCRMKYGSQSNSRSSVVIFGLNTHHPGTDKLWKVLNGITIDVELRCCCA